MKSRNIFFQSRSARERRFAHRKHRAASRSICRINVSRWSASVSSRSGRSSRCICSTSAAAAAAAEAASEARRGQPSNLFRSNYVSICTRRLSPFTIDHFRSERVYNIDVRHDSRATRARDTDGTSSPILIDTRIQTEVLQSAAAIVGRFRRL